MNILIAPDKFKGSLTAHQVASAISRGAKRFDENINCTILPLADGGEGSLQVIQNIDLKTFLKHLEKYFNLKHIFFRLMENI